jgi:hypothetical protein
MARHHAEWLNLIERSGPFLELPVLVRIFPQGLPKMDTEKSGRLRAAYEEWAQAQESRAKDAPSLHGTWIRLVLGELLEFDERVLRTGDRVPAGLSVPLGEHRETLRPAMVVVEPDGRPKHGAARLLIESWPLGQDLESLVPDAPWAASPLERMTQLCRSTNVRLGLVTNGERWTLVDAPVGQTAGYASWYAGLWVQEPITLAAFETLLGVRRFFGVAETDTLESMLDEAVAFQEEVTDQLGYQVRRAVEVLIQALDRADLDRQRELLRDIPPERLYEAALTVMMRLVFLFCAEERGLLLLGDTTYDAHYAVSTLRAQLREEADRVGVEVLERRQDAWARLLATFRAVYDGIEHEALRLPALGGSLFDPDRFPFLEGRASGSGWLETPASPLPIDNRTVLHLLDSLQLLRMRSDAGTSEARKLSYRALDIEQIGHVYEGLLDHVAVRVDTDTLGLTGTKDKDPELSIDALDGKRRLGRDTLVEFLEEHTGRSSSGLQNALDAEIDEAVEQKLLIACGNDKALLKRALPFHALIRHDVWGFPQVYRAGSFMVTSGLDRRQTGTHYTSKPLTEPIVARTLEPLVYEGPAEGAAQDRWKLRSPSALLDLRICDLAMGSAAFLVQVCRWLGERLTESWEEAERSGASISADGEVLSAADECELLPTNREERLVLARRLIAERCIYGVDMNPMGVELAKLSIWLVTLAKGRPFGFLEHNLRCGDSLLGIHRLDQLIELRMKSSSAKKQLRLFGRTIQAAVQDAIELRSRIRRIPIRDITDVDAMARLDVEARNRVAAPEQIADAMIGEALQNWGNASALEATFDSLAIDADRFLRGDAEGTVAVSKRARETLHLSGATRRPFHWPLEFPEVFVRENGGFDAIVGNPPFLGNRLWKTMLHENFQRQALMLLDAAPGKIDLCVLFHRRGVDLLRDRGAYGLLATSNIAEGSGISVGLGEIVKSGDVFFCRKALPWPGTAAVLVAIICFFKAQYRGDKDADGQLCRRIGSRLAPEETDTWVPQPLDDGVFAFAGVDNSKGLAFVITKEHAWFDRLKAEPKSLLRPYITGDDITSYALNRIERWALDIGDRDLAEVKRNYPAAHRFLVEVVKPTRTQQALKSYKGLHDRWWQFWNHRVELMARLRQNRTFIAYSKVTTHPFCMLAPSNWIYTNKVALIGLTRQDLFAICLSSFFRSWIETFSGGALRGWLTLSISESIVKFPLPKKVLAPAAIKAADQFNQELVGWCKDNGCGLTEAINAIYSPERSDATLNSLRTKLSLIDAAAANAFDWDDLDLTNEFREAPKMAGRPPWRYAVSEKTQRELMVRLLQLNRERYEAQEAARMVPSGQRQNKKRA